MKVKGSDKAVIIGVLDPQSGATPGPYTTDWVNSRDFDRVVAVLLLGTITGSGTVDALLQQAKDAAGGSVKSISGKAITQLTGDGSDDNKQAVINVRSGELDVEGGFTHVRLSITIGTAASLISAVMIGMNSRYEPEGDLASVDEVVA